MKSLVIYYSHRGNTAYVADKLADALKQKGQAEIFELEYSDKHRGLLRRLFYRIMPSAVNLEPVPVDLKNYDVLVLGIPVITGHPHPAVLKYISLCKNIENKKIICLCVYGIEALAKKCFGKIKAILQKKGHLQVVGIYVSWLDVRKEHFLNGAIRDVIEKIS